VSFSSLSAGDYPDFSGLLKNLLPDLPPCVSLSVSSLKPSTVSAEILERISLIRKTGLTIVPEAGSQRLRDLIRKNLREDQIMDAVNLALLNRWQRIKLYFMIGLPHEIPEDIRGIVDLLDKIYRRFCLSHSRNRVSVSFSAFVPKPHSPFEREAREDLCTLREKVDFLKSALRGYKQIKYNFHDLRKGEIETVLARGDRRIGDLIEDAYSRDLIFSAWDGEFDSRRWTELMVKYQGRLYLEKIPPDQHLPWAHILISSPPGKKQGPESRKSRGKKANHADLSSSKRVSVSRYAPVRLFYPKEGDFTFLSHLTMIQYVERLVRRTGIPFKYSSGYHPRIRMTALPPLPVFSRSSEEVVEVWLDERWEESDILDRLNRDAESLQFYRVQKEGSSHVKLSRDILTIDYQLDFTTTPEMREDIQSLLTEKDRIQFSPDQIRLKLYYPEKGSERFARVLRIIDPGKNNSHRIWRRSVQFRPHETN
jgi:hypothetical protein